MKQKTSDQLQKRRWSGSALEEDRTCGGNILSGGTWKPGTSGRNGPLTETDWKVSARPVTTHRETAVKGKNLPPEQAQGIRSWSARAPSWNTAAAPPDWSYRRTSQCCPLQVSSARTRRCTRPFRSPTLRDSAGLTAGAYVGSCRSWRHSASRDTRLCRFRRRRAPIPPSCRGACRVLRSNPSGASTRCSGRTGPDGRSWRRCRWKTKTWNLDVSLIMQVTEHNKTLNVSGETWKPISLRRFYVMMRV